MMIIAVGQNSQAGFITSMVSKNYPTLIHYSIQYLVFKVTNINIKQKRTVLQDKLVNLAVDIGYIKKSIVLHLNIVIPYIKGKFGTIIAVLTVIGTKINLFKFNFFSSK